MNITYKNKPIAKAINLSFKDSGNPAVIIIKGKIGSPNPFSSTSDILNKDEFNIINSNHVFSKVVFTTVNTDWSFEANGLL
jgi:hypothetical protein